MLITGNVRRGIEELARKQPLQLLAGAIAPDVLGSRQVRVDCGPPGRKKEGDFHPSGSQQGRSEDYSGADHSLHYASLGYEGHHDYAKEGKVTAQEMERDGQAHERRCEPHESRVAQSPPGAGQRESEGP